ncbi:MAG: YjjG family noncanonical pyrimidine nucleotidase [Jejuia sp.]
MKNPNGITDIFFDLDHTLWDFEKNSASTFEKIFELHNLQLGIEKFLEKYVPINFKYWKLYRQEQISKEDLRFARLDETFKSLEFPLDPDMIYKISDDYIRYLSTFNTLIPGTIEVLEALKPKYKLHIITNGFDEVQYKKMKGSNIIDYFQTLTNSEIAGVKKPNPKIFNFALELAEVRPEQSMMIGDSLEADVEGALNIGMDAIYFNPESIKHNKNIKEISKLSQLIEML